MESIEQCYEEYRQRRIQILKADGDGARELKQMAHDLICLGLSLDTRVLLTGKAETHFMQFPDGKPYVLIQYQPGKKAELGQAAHYKKLHELCDRVMAITGFEIVWVRGVDLLCRAVYRNGAWVQERLYA